MTTRTENDALIDALTDAQISEQLNPGGFYAFKLRDRVETIDLRDPDETRPARKKGTVRVDDLASFVHYYRKHCDAQSEVYVDIQAGVITAVLDAHEGWVSEEERGYMPRWGEHRLTLRLAETDAWRRWAGLDRQFLKQAAFADFIDDNRADIRKPTAADMLELVQQFQAKTKVTFSSATLLASGDRRLTFEEETTAGGGAKGSIEVPSTLELGIAPFEDSEPYVVTARFRYRIQGGALYMGIWLDNATDVRRDAIRTVVAKLQEELGIVVMRGTPA
ncbi:DUF2303 family protein [Streptosporangium jomthongense]|uniref:DUF2303 family protein n=1 Tax=Streptosporangium jomthongense TaxID=1193683 RepID=A0ABV8EYC0_9ACTN